MSAEQLWVIGDLQGCGESFDRLLMRLPVGAHFIFLGDIVNRGPASLHCLRSVRELCLAGRAVALLGNHDLHLLAVAAGIRPYHPDDTFGDILAAPDRAALIDWLRTCPLMHQQENTLFVHAGLLPPWSAAQAMELAAEVQTELRADRHEKYLATLYGNEPARWSDTLMGADRHRCIINAMTRLRFVDAEGRMDLSVKTAPANAPTHLTAWFDHPYRASREHTIVFGHWSALGFMNRQDAVCLDTGCIWGKTLTAMSWPQRQCVQVQCEANKIRLERRPQSSTPA